MIALPFGPRLPFILRRTLPSLAFALAFLTLPPCTAPSARGDDAAPGPTLLPAKGLSSDELDHINQSAQGLAGKKASGEWESSRDWQDYQKTLDGRWSYLSRIRLNAMRTWGGSALSGLRDKTGTVFYPFSGPDALYVDTLFPDSKILLMAGLEPVGTIPDLAKIQKEGKLGPYLSGVQTSLYTILAASFFKTKDMKNDFNNEVVDGLMPAIIVFLARQGYHIDDIQYVALDHDGSLHPHGQGSGAPGVQITYGGGRTLLYFQANLSNDGQSENPGFIRLMHRLAPGVTYLKAASYLLYEDYFSTIREAILQDSVGVVEDDSGIPFKDFKSTEWEVIPYGDYTGPINLFKDKYQSDLNTFYKKTSHDQLAFGSGYKFAASVSSLLVAKKK
jgi:hypothetical protein